MKYFLPAFPIVIIIFCIGCNPGPYAAANKSYKKQTKALGKEVRRNPSSQTMATATAWVGTNVVMMYLYMNVILWMK